MSNRRQGPSTIYDVASLAKVSITTVSRYLNNPGGVKEETGRRISDAMEALDYIPKGNAGSRANRDVGRIGVLTPFFPAPSFVDRLEGMVPVFRQNNYEMVVYTIDSPEHLDEYLSSVPFTRRLDGIILMSVRLTPSQHKKLEASGLQIVMVESDDDHYTRVLADDFRGGQLAGELFLKKGYFPCLYMGDKNKILSYSLHPSEIRLKGFQEKLKEENRIVDHIIECATTVEDAQDVFEEYLKHNQAPRGIFAMSDLHAIGIIKALRSCDISVPEETAVLGFDNISPTAWMEISTISQNLGESGRVSANLLLDRIKEKTQAIQKVNLQVNLVERSTT